MGLPLSKLSGDPSNGEIEAKPNRIGLRIHDDHPERIGLDGFPGPEVVRSWDLDTCTDRIVGRIGRRINPVYSNPVWWYFGF